MQNLAEPQKYLSFKLKIALYSSTAYYLFILENIFMKYMTRFEKSQLPRTQQQDTLFIIKQ